MLSVSVCVRQILKYVQLVVSFTCPTGEVINYVFYTSDVVNVYKWCNTGIKLLQ